MRAVTVVPGRAGYLPQGAHRLRQVVPGHVLHRDEVLVVDGAQFEDLDDVRMIQASRQLGLVDEHPHECRIVRKMRQDALDHEHPFEAGRALDAPLEHLGHTPAPDALVERVLAELNRLGEGLAQCSLTSRVITGIAWRRPTGTTIRIRRRRNHVATPDPPPTGRNPPAVPGYDSDHTDGSQ